MGKQKQPSISIPEYKQPERQAFNLFGNNAAFDTGTNTWNVTNPQEASTMQEVSNIRSNLLKSLGVGGDISQDNYTQTMMNELLRLTQPRTENALIGRGLGGSTVYKDAMTDLITKAGAQSILGGQQYKQNDLAMLNDYLNNQNTMGYNLLNLAQGNDLQNQQLAQNMYGMTLPYKATYNAGSKGWGGALGGLLGTGLGFMMGPAGATDGISNKLVNSVLGGTFGSAFGGAF